MSLEAYKRYNQREKTKDKKIKDQEIIFGITQKDLFKQEIYPLNRLTGNKGTSHSMPKNKNTIIHSNSTNLLNKAIKNNMKENNYNIININVNNLIINNNKEMNNNHNSNNLKVFGKVGNDIIDGKEKRTVVRLEPIRQNYSRYDVIKLLDNYLKIESGKNQRIYNALYVPLCKVLGKNMGYCFVMMVKPKYVIDFYNVFNGKIFGKKICKKPCKVTWADIQGEEFLDPNEDDPFRKPIIFKDIINEEGDE